MKNSMIAVTVSCALLVSGCATDGQNGAGGGTVNKETVGTVLGGILGAVAGSKFGKGNGQLAAVAFGALAGAYLGNQFGASLDEADRQALNRKSAEALASAKDGQTVSWSNPDSGASAVITPQASREETRKVPMLRSKSIAPLPAIVLIGETWEAKANANVRSAPSLDAEVVSTLKTGETFTAVGKVDGKDWIVVSRNNRTIGYVTDSLVQVASPAPSSAPVLPVSAAPMIRDAIDLDALENDSAVNLDDEGLVAEEVVVSATCRDVDVAISTKDGNNEQHQMKACKAPDGAWEIL